MAKKAVSEEKEEKKVKETDLEKKYGSNAFVSAEDFMNEKRVVVPVCPKLDMILGGGVPEGSFVIFAGPPKIGKTVTSLHFAANAQALGRKVYYLNIEGRLKPRDLEGIPKLQRSIDKFEIVRSFKNEDGSSRILLAHEYLDIAESKIKSDPGCVIIVDSASQLLTETEEQGELGQQHRAPGAVLLAQFCKKIANTLPVSGCIVIMIVHVVANTGGGMKKKARTGGNKIQYAVDVDLECTFTERWKVGGSADNEESGTEIGKKIHWVTGSTAGNAAPGMEAVSYLRYGIGIDETYELYDLGKTVGLIDRSGSWYKLTYLGLPEDETPKAQGEDKLMAIFNEHPEYVDTLRMKLKEILG